MNSGNETGNQSANRGIQFRDHYSSQEIVDKYPDCSGPSMTQPGEAQSIEQVIRAYAQGVYLPGSASFYDDPEGLDLSEFDQLDPFEKAMYLQEQREYLQELEERSRLQPTPPAGAEGSATGSESEARAPEA